MFYFPFPGFPFQFAARFVYWKDFTMMFIFRWVSEMKLWPEGSGV